MFSIKNIRIFQWGNAKLPKQMKCQPQEQKNQVHLKPHRQNTKLLEARPSHWNGRQHSATVAVVVLPNDDDEKDVKKAIRK